jgi:ABC-type sugar transport system ATPase subunit
MALRMTGISKSFSGTPVLDDVSFELKPGEVHVLAGENGAGKTTLIKILAGVYSDYSGEITWDGERLKFKSPAEAAARGIVAIHQDLAQVASLSVRDNLFLGRERTRAGLWMDYRAEAAEAASFLKEFGVEVDLRRPIGEYPVSVRQMIEIARAMIADAGAVIMDEPTSALNAVEVERLFAIIGQLRSRNRGIVFISHRLEEIYRIGDRITVLRDGSLIGTEGVKALTPDRLFQWMVGRDVTGQFPSRTASLGETVLEVRDFCVADPSRPVRRAVENVQFDLRAGEILGIAGLQGSGKSELLNGLFGAYGRPAGGSVRLRGRPFRVKSPSASIAGGMALLTNDRKGTGLVPEMGIVPNMTLASLRKFSPWGWLKPRREDSAAEGYMRALSIRARSLRQEAGTLSGGNQQKVVMAKWLQAEPRALLLDEPTLGVDVGAKHDIYRLLNDWTEEGKAILMVTSEIEELLALSDRILVMHRGRVVSEFKRGAAGRERIIQAAMGA